MRLHSFIGLTLLNYNIVLSLNRWIPFEPKSKYWLLLLQSWKSFHYGYQILGWQTLDGHKLICIWDLHVSNWISLGVRLWINYYTLLKLHIVQKDHTSDLYKKDSISVLFQILFHFKPISYANLKLHWLSLYFWQLPLKGIEGRLNKNAQNGWRLMWVIFLIYSIRVGLGEGFLHNLLKYLCGFSY